MTLFTCARSRCVRADFFELKIDEIFSCVVAIYSVAVLLRLSSHFLSTSNQTKQTIFRGRKKTDWRHETEWWNILLHCLYNTYHGFWLFFSLRALHTAHTYDFIGVGIFFALHRNIVPHTRAHILISAELLSDDVSVSKAQSTCVSRSLHFSLRLSFSLQSCYAHRANANSKHMENSRCSTAHICRQIHEPFGGASAEIGSLREMHTPAANVLIQRHIEQKQNKTHETIKATNLCWHK